MREQDHRVAGGGAGHAHHGLHHEAGVQVQARRCHGGAADELECCEAAARELAKSDDGRTFVGAVRPDSGKLVASGVFAPKTYKTEQTIGLLREIRTSLPDIRRIHLVWDNGSTHRSAAMRVFLASEEGKAFNVLYTPTHASWLNLAENFLSRFSRRYLHGKRWTGLDAFDVDMVACIEAYATVAKPMRWRYNPREQAESTGRPSRRARRGRRYLRPASPESPARA